MSTSETVNEHFLCICFSFHFAPQNLNLLKLCSNYAGYFFAPPGKHYRIGLLFIHKKWLGRGGGTDLCDGAKLRPGPKEESLVGDGGEVLPIYGLYRFSIYTLSDLGDLSNLIGSLFSYKNKIKKSAKKLFLSNFYKR